MESAIKFGSVCSGIEAASVAWEPLGWNAAFFSEIEPFPCSVLAHHYPDVPNLGDMTKFKKWGKYDIDVFVGGTPCQSFSVAGLRGGMADPRGNLALTYLAIADKYRPNWLVWENVPGVLSSNEGRDFGTFLGGLAELGYGFAYRVLDAQHFGVPQRRRRVFVVGHSGDWRCAAAVLFERHSLQGHSSPGRKKGADVTGTLDASFGRSRGAGQNPSGITQALGGGGADDNKAQGGFYVPAIIGQAMSCKWSKGSSGPAGDEHHNLVAAINPIAFHGSQDPGVSGDVTHSCGRNGGLETCVAFTQNQAGDVLTGNVAAAIGTNSNATGRNTAKVMSNGVRRLTPLECERLQGFPDGYTNVRHRGKAAADGPRYKAIGNSMAVPVMRWIGERIQMVEQILEKKQ